MTPGKAEEIGIEALVWMSSREDTMAGFLAASGASIDDLRQQSQDKAFLGFVLDYIMTHDEYVLEFAELSRIAPGDVAAARMALPGGEQPNWT